MNQSLPRGIAVADVGYTNTKVVLFNATGEPVAERKVASVHRDGPPYRWIDPEPMVALFRRALSELDAILPVDAVVPSAHGAAVALIAADGSLAMPVMDYQSDPPADVVADYKKLMPPFAECSCPLLPLALTHGLQLYWQQRQWPGDFARATTIVPWIQYVGFRLCGTAVTEITSMSCQTHLMNVAQGGLSSLVKSRGWEKLFPPMARSWQVIGALKPEFRGSNFRGRGDVLAGIHDSSANFVRYLSGGFGRFTLLSTGTWSISFDTSAAVADLREEFDTATNTSIFGDHIATSRFFGGMEYEKVAATDTQPDLTDVATLIASEVFALPSFTGSAGPMPGTENKGRIIGSIATPRERASLAALYCALMVSEQLDHVKSRHDIIVDGPFAQNAVLLAVLAALRPGQRVLASELRDGTTAGAACLALMADGKLPHIDIKVAHAGPASLEGLAAYQKKWKELVHAQPR
jgi:sugar (pentulose or hexulose) kinase